MLPKPESNKRVMLPEPANERGASQEPRTNKRGKGDAENQNDDIKAPPNSIDNGWRKRNKSAKVAKSSQAQTSESPRKLCSTQLEFYEDGDLAEVFQKAVGHFKTDFDDAEELKPMVS